MLSTKQITLNKEAYINLLRQINIEGADIEGLIAYLNSTDFFEAPASTVYHSNYAGGLCEHCLNVYTELINIINLHQELYATTDPSSYIIVALCHDFAKINFYEKYVVNKKFYDARGSKSDNIGRFDWFAEEAYKVKDISDRSVAGTHGYNSLIVTNRYIPLSEAESIAILNHMGISAEENNRDLSEIYNRYPLASALHLADTAATFLMERKEASTTYD